MFVPKAAKSQEKGPQSQTRNAMPERSMAAERPFCVGAVEQAHWLQRTIGNLATLRLLTAPGGASPDFGRMAVFPAGRAGAPPRGSAVTRAPTAGFLQAKLIVGDVNDPLENEADRVAESVMREPGEALVPAKVSSRLSRKCAACTDEETRLQRKAARSDSSSPVVPALLHDVLRSPGRPLDPATRSFMEERFADDFGGVRIHADGKAAESARALQARAFTVGADVVFGHRQFAPATGEGQRLIAHELAHVIQQRSAAGAASHASAPSFGAAPSRISRSPDVFGEQDIHSKLIEEFRKENGLPPHGINPFTGQQEGPTDSEIRFGGLLDAWLANRRATQTPSPAPSSAPSRAAPVRGVPAPTRAPAITAPGSTSVVAACKGAPDEDACRSHRKYVLNILPQAIKNIRSVASPYSAAIADLYAAALRAAQAAPAPTHKPGSKFSSWEEAKAGPVTVTFGGTKFTFTQFTINLLQESGTVNGQAFGMGGPVAAINLNETSDDALLSNIAGVEATMVHETMHIFMAIVEERNKTRAAGAPVAEPNLDPTSYAALQASLETALLPFINEIMKLPSYAGLSVGSAASNASSIAGNFISEAIARTEAGIFANQRAGKAFGAADLHALPKFIHAMAYWEPKSPKFDELEAYLKTNQARIDAAIQPLIDQIGERYLNLRP